MFLILSRGKISILKTLQAQEIEQKLCPQPRENIFLWEVVVIYLLYPRLLMIDERFDSKARLKNGRLIYARDRLLYEYKRYLCFSEP